MEVRFPPLYEWQQPVFNAVTHDTEGRQYLVVAKRQVGKSIVAQCILLFFAFKEKSIGCLIEPTIPQCRRVFRQMLDAVGGEGSPCIKRANATLLEIEFVNGSQIVFKSAEMSESALRGLSVKKSVLIFDEAAFLQSAGDDGKDVFSILYPVVDASNSPVLFISTPLFESGEFYNKYKAGIEGSKMVQVFDWSEYDTSALLPPDKLEYYRQTLPALRFRSEYEGKFLKEHSLLFGDFTKCYGPLSKKPPKFGGLDWGSTGTDSTVLILLDEDKCVYDIQTWKNLDSVELVDKIAAYLSKLPSLQSLVVETNSIGDVYLGMLKRKVRKGLIKEFTTTNESKRRIIENIITAFQTGRITIPQDAELTKQLQHFSLEKTPTGKITYSGYGAHDDYVMALAFANEAAKNKNSTTIITGFA